MRAIRALLLLLATASPLAAQQSLHWREIRVDATLATGGALRVKETQTIVFTGDWNGGERRFDVRPRQRFEFTGLQRIDSVGGAHAMRAGDLSVVDGYDFTDRRTLRWRSRLPSDPPFNETVITYVLEYSFSNILVPEGDNWILDHDFGFADRAGVIENFVVNLDLEPEWQPTMPFAGTYQARNLPSGEGFVVRVPMRYTGEAEVSAADLGADPTERGILAVVTLILLGSLGRRLYTRERGTGRLDPLSPEAVDERWLDEHVFKHLPEVVGAAWDNKTEASEVAAVLARLVSEGKMRSEVRPGGMFKGPVLHLELLVDRDRFHGHERRLVDAFFQGTERTTDTASIRERYKKSGFNPADKIRKPLKDLVKSLVRGADTSRPTAWPSFLAFLGAITLLVNAVVLEPADAPVVFLVGVVTIICYFIALAGAASWRNRVHDVAATALFFLVPMGIALSALLTVVISGVTRASALALAGLSLLFIALANSTLNQARSRENAERIAFRRRLAIAREFFVEELRRDTPRLKDSWFPYLIAFGLGKHMDKWFRAFAGESSMPLTNVGYSSGGRGGGSSGGGWTGFGGGGGFSGGGSSGSWAAAAGSIASGVSAPSSSGGSSGGGGGGGGGSSGGGGGGGW